MIALLHDLVTWSADRTPDATALRYQGNDLAYRALADSISRISGGLISAGIETGDRIAIYLPKQPEAVISFFAATMAGGVFVPVNPRLRPAQVRHILQDSGARALVTSADRAQQLASELEHCTALKLVLLCDSDTDITLTGKAVLPWQQLAAAKPGSARRIDTDLAALLYTSGSTGQPKGVMLSHRNLVAGAASVSSYLENNNDDRILTILPFSFDYGFSQLTTAFYSGATAVLFDYLLPRDVIRTVEREGVTGLACVPPVWIQLARLEWSAAAAQSLRYITNSGGAMPLPTLRALQQRLPDTRLFLMYGLTEAFRSTYLDPEELDRRPGSIGKAIPNAEVLIVRPDGSRCVANEPGELVHRGALVAQGYWNDPGMTEERFRPAPEQPTGASLNEMAVWSGDTVRADDEGYMYFIGRRDAMIKTFGYRVSPTEIEEVLYASGQVSEVVCLGVPHPELGQAVVAAAVSATPPAATEPLLDYCREYLASYMVPMHIEWRERLPRNANGKIDRANLAESLQDLFAEVGI